MFNTEEDKSIKNARPQNRSAAQRKTSERAGEGTDLDHSVCSRALKACEPGSFSLIAMRVSFASSLAQGMTGRLRSRARMMNLFWMRGWERSSSLSRLETSLTPKPEPERTRCMPVMNASTISLLLASRSKVRSRPTMLKQRLLRSALARVLRCLRNASVWFCSYRPVMVCTGIERFSFFFFTPVSVPQ